jgi:hypothetical protein
VKFTMTEDKIKEALSNNYVSCIANKLGFRLVKWEGESGVDFKIMYNLKRKMPNGKTAYVDSPYTCDIQLKATTTKSIEIKRKKIIYKLRAKNYNDLIYRKQIGYTPLILILFILPEEEKAWVRVLQDKLILSKNAYWFYPSITEIKEVTNESSKTITIPLAQKLDFSFFQNQIKNWVPEWK